MAEKVKDTTERKLEEEAAAKLKGASEKSETHKKVEK